MEWTQHRPLLLLPTPLHTPFSVHHHAAGPPVLPLPVLHGYVDKYILQKCRGIQGWQCQKPYELGIGMAVSSQERLYKDYTSNPIPTSFFFTIVFTVISQCSLQKDNHYLQGDSTAMTTEEGNSKLQRGCHNTVLSCEKNWRNKLVNSDICVGSGQLGIYTHRWQNHMTKYIFQVGPDLFTTIC